jgi:hypothetical protein
MSGAVALPLPAEPNRVTRLLRRTYLLATVGILALSLIGGARGEPFLFLLGALELVTLPLGYMALMAWGWLSNLSRGTTGSVLDSGYVAALLTWAWFALVGWFQWSAVVAVADWVDSRLPPRGAA